jgi:hypothetical protein
MHDILHKVHIFHKVHMFVIVQLTCNSWGWHVGLFTMTLVAWMCWLQIRSANVGVVTGTSSQVSSWALW